MHNGAFSVAVAIAQLFLIIGLGALLARRELPLIGRFEPTFWRQLPQFIYRVALPCLTFAIVARIRWDSGMATFARTIAVSSIAIVIASVAAAVILPIRPSGRRLVAAISHSPNSVYLGFPLILAVLGPAALAKAALVGILHIVFSMVVAVAVLGYGESTDRTSAIRMIARKWSRDPFVLSCLAGIMWSAFSIPLPDAVGKPLDLVGGLAPPLSMLVVGANLRFERGHAPAVAGLTAIRLGLAPVVLIGVLTVLGTGPSDRLLLTLQLSTPLATSAVPFVEEYVRDPEASAVTASALTVSTIASLITLPLIAALIS